MRRALHITAILTLTIIPVVAALIPLGASRYVSAEQNTNIDGGRCVSNCRDPVASDSSTGADASASGASGNDGTDVNTGATCAGLSQLDGTECGNGAGRSAIGKVASKVVNIISYLAGIIAIIMIIISGIKYATSGGDSAKVSAAKTTLVYALIGVAVVALAQFMVHYVLASV